MSLEMSAQKDTLQEGVSAGMGTSARSWSIGLGLGLVVRAIDKNLRALCLGLRAKSDLEPKVSQIWLCAI